MKIISLKKAAQVAKALKKSGKKIVTINGSFDLFHAGHLEAIESAKKAGDVLFVGLNSDISYKKYKDKRGPVIKEKNRATLLAGLSAVDFVVIFDEPDPLNFVKKIKPDVHANAKSYGKECVEAPLLRAIRSKLLLIGENSKKSLSTSAIIKKIVQIYSKPMKRGIFLDRDGIINVDKGYTHRINDLEFMPGIIELLQRMRNLGYIFIVVSNQSGIGRKLYKESDMMAFNKELEKRLGKKKIKIEAWYHCPHNPEKKLCDCRKPGSVLFQKAIKEHSIDPKRSFALGDKESDVVAAKRVGLTTILLSKNLRDKTQNADFRVKYLSAIKNIIRT